MKGKKREKLIIGAIGLLLILAVMPGAAYAFVPETINYQGYLADSGGDPIDGTVGIVFTLWDDDTSGNSVWTEIHASVSVTKGIFSVILGESSSLAALDPVGDLWLGVKVGIDPEMTPRQKMTSVAYSLRAGEAESVVADAVTGAQILDESVSSDDIAGFTATTTGTFLGEDAGLVNTGTDNTFLGYSAGSDNTTGNNNTFIGSETGVSNVGGFENTFIGSGAGSSNVGGLENTFLGYIAGNSNTTGSNNIFLGNQAGFNNTGGGSNTFLGYSAGNSNTTGSNNIFLGLRSGNNNTEGSNNTFLGYRSGYLNTTGNNNTSIGNYAGFTNTGSNNVFLGSQAGYNETGSNKLYIDNSSTSSPLIHGDFSTDEVTVNGDLTVTGEIKGFTVTTYPTISANSSTQVEWATGSHTFCALTEVTLLITGPHEILTWRWCQVTPDGDGTWTVSVRSDVGITINCKAYCF